MNFPNIKLEKEFRNICISSYKKDEKAIQKICKYIQLSKIVSIFIPDSTTIESIKYPYYSIEGFRIADIFTKSFIDGYVLNGNLCLSSTNNNENCQILLSEQKLRIKLDRELYYSLAAIHLTEFLRKSENDKKYVSFEIDLNNTNVHKIRNELLYEEIDKVSVYFDWHPADDSICRSSLAKFLSNMGYTVKEYDNKYLNNLLYSFKIFKLPIDELNGSTYDEWRDVLDNIGMHMLQCNTEEISVNGTTDVIKIKRGNVLHYKGFIPESITKNLFMELQNILRENSSIPYIAVSSIPFSNLQNHFYSKLYFLTQEKIYLASE